jgi:hypothetical protein
MPGTSIVPFGKYKGQPLEALQQDQAYCEWLVGQDWFRTRFTAIHTLIINNFGTPGETPEHNQLQARFLDDEWLCRFLTARVGVARVQIALSYLLNIVRVDRNKAHEDLHASLTQIQQRDSQAEVQKEIARAVEYRNLLQGETWQRENVRVQQLLATQTQAVAEKEARNTKELAEVEHGIAAWDAEVQPLRVLDPKAVEWGEITTVFEQKGVDVVVVAVAQLRGGPEFVGRSHVSSYGQSRYTVSERGELELFKEYRFAVELKPLFGDDYPAVLRQMRASNCDTLVIEDYTGSGASLEQVRKMFLPLVILTVEQIDQTESL